MENNGTSKAKLLTWARETSGHSVENFTTSWFDGKVLAEILFKLVRDVNGVSLNTVKNNYNDKTRLEHVLKTFDEKLKVQQVLSVEGMVKKEVDEYCMILYVFLIYKASLKPPQSSEKTLQSQSSNGCDKNWKQDFKKWGRKEIDFQKAVDSLEGALKSNDDVNVENIIRRNLFFVYDNEAFKLQCDGNLKDALAHYKKASEVSKDETDKEIMKQKVAVVEKLTKRAEEIKTSEKKFLTKFRSTVKSLDGLCEEQKYNEALKSYYTVSHDVVKAASRADDLAINFSRIFLTITEGMKREGTLSKQDFQKQAKKFCSDSSFGGTFKDCTIHLHSNYNGNS